MNLTYVFLLSIAVGLDSLFAGVAYGLRSIRMPFSSVLIIGIVTSLGTSLSMLSAHLVGQFVQSRITLVIGASVLIMVGLFNILKVYLSNGPNPGDRNGPGEGRQIIFKIGGLVISVMANPELADLDASKSISAGEALLLSLALGIDNMVATFAANMAGPLPLYTPIIMGFIQMIFITAGDYGAQFLIFDRLKSGLPYLSGGIIIILGLVRLFQ